MSSTRVVVWTPPLSRPFLEKRLSRIEAIELLSASETGEVAQALVTCDVLVTAQHYYLPEVERAVKEHARRLQWIQLVTAGYEMLSGGRIPPEILVTNAGEGLGPTVAEHAIALLLALGRRLDVALRNQSEHRWDQSTKESAFSLYGKTMVIVGFGPIGRHVARLARAFGAKVVGVSRQGIPHSLADEMHSARDLDQLLPRADVLVLAVPLTTETRGMIDAIRFSRCKSGMLLVNVARGAIVDTTALAEALTTGWLGGAGLDVTDPEPLPPDHPLWSAPNLIVTPHVAAGGGYGQLADFVGANVERFLRGEQPLSQIRI